uniref:SAM domain-containing protein n=1 Tax=Ciona savignyi TaxID=51511 RepID=H2YNZ0_CIOSA
MTGLGSDGKPHPHATVPHFLQDHPPSHANNEVRPPSWEGPKDLETLLSEIDCSKHLPIFNKQDIDLRVFLTLTEDDLKEIGITLFGPRRRMVSCIARLSSGAPIHLDRIESAYADSLNAKLLQLQNKLKE